MNSWGGGEGGPGKTLVCSIFSVQKPHSPNSPSDHTADFNPFLLSPFALSPILLTLLLWPDQWTIAWLCAESPVRANVVLVSFSSSVRKRVALSGSRSGVPGSGCPPSRSTPRGLLLEPSPWSAFSRSAPLRLLRPERGATTTGAPASRTRSRDSARSPGATENRGRPRRGGGVAGALLGGPW